MVGAASAILVDPDEELFGNGGVLPPLNERRDDELVREPGRRGDGTPAYEKPVVSVREGLVEMVPDECY